MTTAPFPFASLPAISRAELIASSRVREACDGLVGPDAVAQALSELAGESVAIHVRRVRPLDVARMPTDGVGVVFAAPEAASFQGAVLVELEPALASALIARALRQRAPRIVAPGRPSPEIAGAAAALLHAALRRVRTGEPVRVLAAGPGSVLARDLAAANGAVVTAWATVVLGGDAFDARVSMPEAVLPSSRRNGLTRDTLGALGEAPLALPIVIATCFAGRSMLASLRAGDAFVLPATELRCVGDRLCGSVAIVAPSGERGLRADLGEDGRLVLGSGPLESFPWDHPIGGAMSGENATLEVLEDAPVVVRVELGAIEMAARDWAALTPGDVVTLGKKLGDPASLRVGGVEVARGELVQIDGELGVRILPRGGRS